MKKKVKTLKQYYSGGVATSPEEQAMLDQQVEQAQFQQIDSVASKVPVYGQIYGAAKGASYIPWMFVEKYLDHFAPGWSTKSVGFSTPVGATIITELSIPTRTGIVTRAGHGFEAHQTNSGGVVKDTGFGGAPVIASRQAFKRASVAFGLGRDLYPV